MNINITGRNIDLTPEIKKYVTRKLAKLERFYNRIDRCEVILEQEKIRCIAEVVIHLRRTSIVAKESTSDIYASIDNAAEVVTKQLRRLRGKVHAKRRKAVLARFMGSPDTERY